MTDTTPEVWGNGCECWVTPENYWFRVGSAVEPGSQAEFNPMCPIHRTHTHDGVRADKAIRPRGTK
jgi:hypothetical protein